MPWVTLTIFYKKQKKQTQPTLAKIKTEGNKKPHIIYKQEDIEKMLETIQELKAEKECTTLTQDTLEAEETEAQKIVLICSEKATYKIEAIAEELAR